MKSVNVDQSELYYVPTPEGTKTWNPVSHFEVSNVIDKAVKEQGMDIIKKRFELTREGANLFATYSLDQGSDGKTWQLGFRNSTCKQFAVGVTAGNLICVCSNLVFSGDFIEFRKHTSGLDFEELTLLANRAMHSTVKQFKALETWQSSLYTYPMPLPTFHELTFKAMSEGAFSPSHFHKYLEAYKDEYNRSGESLHTFHGAVTQTIREQSLGQIQQRSRILERLVNDQMREFNDWQAIGHA